jgi:hypothetical protein
VDVQDYIDARLVHEIHTSERKSFRGCRRRWNWIFRENYYPFMTAKPLEFGTAFHKGMEVYYDPKTWSWEPHIKAALATNAFVEKCEKQKKAALEFQDRAYLDDEVETDYQERLELGKGMLRYYFNEVAPREDVNWTPVAVEIEFIVPIPHPDTKETIWCTCDVCFEKWMKSPIGQRERAAYDYLTDEEYKRKDGYFWQGLPVCYAGRLDMLARDPDNDLWIFDWKTARSIPDKYQFLYLDDQVGSYPWALRKALGLKVRGFVYHAQRKGYPQPPKRNKTRRLGCIYSVNRNQEVDYESYLKTVQEEDKEAYEAGHYDDFLDFLKEEGIVYYARHEIHKSDDELDEIERNIGLEALDMIDEAIRIYPSPGRFGCDFCAFQTPCMEMNAKGDYTYALDTLFERREHYYIRNEPSTESKGAE